MAGIVAAICAAWIRLGVMVVGEPPGGVNVTVEPVAKFAPATVTGVAGLDTSVENGVTEFTTGAGGSTMNVWVTDAAGA